MTVDGKTVLIVVVLAAAAWFVNYLLREWPRARRTMFDAHVDDAFEVIRQRPPARLTREDVDDDLTQFTDRLLDEVERDRDREAFERLIHPSAGNGLADLDSRRHPWM